MRPSAILVLMTMLVSYSGAQERQLTATPRNHSLDNNDNYSHDNRYLCYDTRLTLAQGNGSSTSIMKVDVRTGTESVVYEPKPVVLDPVNAAPGVIAASYNPVADEIVFIHGPFVSETAKIGFYGKTNRRGAVVPADGSGKVKFLDLRDVTSDVTPPGAHRGGTHRHEFSLDGKRVGFTYDDHILTQYGRTIGMLTPHPKAPTGVTSYFTILVPVVPEAEAKPGDIVMAASDSWVGPHGEMRAFIGKVKEANGKYSNSLFVVDVPVDVDVTTATSGTKTKFPTPPKGLKVRRLTTTEVTGNVRGSRDGKRIAFISGGQVWLINTDGTGLVQATHLNTTPTAVRWHPKGNSIAFITDHGVATTCVKPGPSFGKTTFITQHGSSLTETEALVFSNDGMQVAFNRRPPLPTGAKDAMGHNFQQIYLAPFPDSNGNGIADPLE